MDPLTSAGEPEPLALLHGALVSRSMRSRSLAALDRRRSVRGLDLPAHGGRPDFAGSSTVEVLAPNVSDDHERAGVEDGDVIAEVDGPRDRGSASRPRVAALVVALLGAIAAAQPLTTERVWADGGWREALVHVPSSLADAAARPLVIAFHGGASHALAMAAYTGLRRTADAHGFVVAFPEGSGRVPGVRTWNAGECCAYAVAVGVDDVAFTVRLIDALVDRHRVDPDRVYLTGISNGALMAYRVALERPERIAAIAPVAGAMALDPGLVRTPVPVLHVHGTEDRHAPFDGGVGPASVERGVRRSVPDTLAAWVRAHGADPVPVVARLPDLVDDGTRVERHAFAAAGDPEAVVLVLVVGGGHTWPGATLREAMLGPSTRDVDANELLWAYFAPRSARRPRARCRRRAHGLG